MSCIDGELACGVSRSGRYDGTNLLYKFTITADTGSMVQFDSCASDYDTLLRVQSMDLSTNYTSCDDCGSCGSQAVLDASLAPGDYILSVEGYGTSRGNYDIMMACSDQLNGIPITATSTVAVDSDDGEESMIDQSVTIDSDDLELSFDGVVEQMVGVRFPDVRLSTGASVSEAHITFVIDEANALSGAPVTLSITAEAVGDSAPIRPAAGDISSRTTLTSAIEWTPGPSQDTNRPLNTPDISSLIEEVTTQPGWAAGNAIMIIITRTSGQGVRWVKTQGNTYAPSLSYTYQSDGFTDGTIYCGQVVHGTTVGEGSHIGNGASDHIYSFHVPPSRAGLVQFDSCGSTFDTWIRVMSHHMADEIISCDDCGPCGVQSVVEVELETGDYVVVLEGYASSEGDYTLAMNCFGGGREGSIQCGSTVRGNTVGTVSSLGNGGGDHFYSFTVNSTTNAAGVEQDQMFQFDSCGSSYDTYLRIFELDLGEELSGCDDCK